MIVEWSPPAGSAIKFGPSGGYVLTNLDGLTSTSASPTARKSSGQYGQTFVDRGVGSRTVAAQVLVSGHDALEYRDRLDALVAALAGIPGTQVTPPLGMLRLHRDDGRIVETHADPVDSPREVGRWESGNECLVDIEWFCPSPLWRSTIQQTVVLSLVSDDPWTSPWDAPWTSPAATAEAEVVNGGHVPVGPVVRFFGPQTEAALTNVSTGETMQVFGAIADGEVVEVDTDARTVKLDGVPILGRWDFNGAWWQLRKGSQQVRASALSASGDARTVVTWLDAYAGV